MGMCPNTLKRSDNGCVNCQRQTHEKEEREEEEEEKEKKWWTMSAKTHRRERESLQNIIHVHKKYTFFEN